MPAGSPRAPPAWHRPRCPALVPAGRCGPCERSPRGRGPPRATTGPAPAWASSPSSSRMPQAAGRPRRAPAGSHARGEGGLDHDRIRAQALREPMTLVAVRGRDDLVGVRREPARELFAPVLLPIHHQDGQSCHCLPRGSSVRRIQIERNRQAALRLVVYRHEQTHPDALRPPRRRGNDGRRHPPQVGGRGPRHHPVPDHRRRQGHRRSGRHQRGGDRAPARRAGPSRRAPRRAR